MKKDNNYIRKEADDLLKGKLRRLFHQNKMNLKEHEAAAGEDNGTDFYFDVTSENEEHNFFFRNQNKGTFDDLVIIKNDSDENQGKISYQISLRNVSNYYYEFDEAIIFTICDLNSKKIYWYDIQNDLSLKERILNQKNKDLKSIQIYIPTENILNVNTLKKFIDKIHYSKYIQLRKKKHISGNLEADYSKIEVDIKDKHIIDKTHYVIKLFEGISVLPTDIISKLIPFKGTNKNTYVNGFNLYTDNEDFFTLISNFILVNEEIILKSNEIVVENQNAKLKDILFFLNIHHIYHIRWTGKKYKNQICVHELFHYKVCDCGRCNLERLNFKRTTDLLDKELDNHSNYEKLRKGYTYYLLGNYIKSVEVFYDIYSETGKANNPINYTISTYNLSKLRKLINYSYYENDKSDILKKLSDIDFDIDEPFIKNTAPYFLDIYKNIKSEKFYEDVKNDVERCFSEIQKISFNDKYGVTYSNNKYNDLKSSFLRFTSYLKHNFIIFNHYLEFEELSKKVLESMFALYTIKNPDTEKYKKFDWGIIEMWIFHIEENYSKYLLRKYDIKKIKVDELQNINKRLNELVENLIFSNELLNDVEGWNKPIRIEKILNRIVSITSILDLDFTEKENIISNIIKLCNVIENKNNIPYDRLVKFVENNEIEIKKELIKQILDLFFFDEHERFGFGRVINIYSEKCSKIEVVEFIKNLLKIDHLDEIEVDIENKFFKELLYTFTFLNDDIKVILKRKILKSLKNDFNDELYNLASIYDLIDYDKLLFMKFVSLIPDKSNNDKSNFLNRINENINLGSTINLIFKFDIEINVDLKNLSKKSHIEYYDYYCWLLDIENFDYSKFNPYWILVYQTVYYFNRFKKSQVLKNELAKCLRENYIEGVAKVYFQHIAQ